jgi:hypothetical protein
MKRKMFLMTLCVLLFGMSPAFQIQAVFAYTMDELLKLSNQIKNENPGIDFKIRLDKEQYKAGEDVVIEFMADKDCYVALIDIGTSGRTIILFPNKWHPDNKIEKDKIYAIPPPGSNFSYRVMGPDGEEHIKAIASVDPVLSKIDSLQEELKQPIETKPEKGQASSGQVFLSMKDPGVVLKDIGIVFQKLDPSKWATVELPFKIVNAGQAPPATSQTQQPSLSKPAESTEVVKGKGGFLEIWYDPNKWKVGPSSNPSAEFAFTHSAGDAYVNVIAERISVPIATLKKAFLENIRNVASDVTIKEEKEVRVNQEPFTSILLNCTVQGIPLTYYSYLWSGKSGAIQVLGFSGQNLFQDYRNDLEKFMNGLVITKP